MKFKHCKVGMKVVCISGVPKGCSSDTNPVITTGDVLTIKKTHEYETGKNGINFEEISFLWYPEDFRPLTQSIKKL